LVESGTTQRVYLGALLTPKGLHRSEACNLDAKLPVVRQFLATTQQGFPATS